jgi:RimJ/RimL family protein N-acetyltransferase
MPFPEEIQTPRLVMRRWREDDLPGIRSVWADPLVAGALRPGEAIDLDAVARATVERRMANWTRDGFGLLTLRLREGDGEIIGWSGAWRQDLARAYTGDVEVGWTLRSPWWGRGLATEAAHASMAAAFEHLGLERVISLIHPANAASTAVAERLGMAREGTTPHNEVPGLELVVYSLARSSFGASPQSRSSR